MTRPSQVRADEAAFEVTEDLRRGKDTELRYDENSNVVERRTDGRLAADGYVGGKTATFRFDRLDREISMVRVVLEQMRIGQSLELALERLRDRVPSRELGVLVGTLVIQQRSGGDVVSALQGLSETLEQRKDLMREVRTLMAGPVFTAYVVAFMGVGTVFLLNAISPGVIDRMLASAAGIAVFVVAGILYTIGLLLVRRVTQVET